MNDKQKSIREQKMKAQRNLMIVWVISFCLMPVICWNDWQRIFQVGTVAFAICAASYVIFAVGFFLFFLFIYKKIAKENETLPEK
jgi:hypothetical protein